MSDLLRIADLSRDDLTHILTLSERADIGRPLEGRGWRWSSNSIEMAVVRLGGHLVPSQADEVGLGAYPLQALADVLTIK